MLAKVKMLSSAQAGRHMDVGTFECLAEWGVSLTHSNAAKFCEN